jgi:anti-sigma regulatory factor (Ser/Thr protein kinase)
MAALAGMLVAASTEMINNAHEHSQAAATCLACFHASPARFEFVVADQGIGPLQSLRSSRDFCDLSSQGAALRTALTDGCSRHGPAAKRGLFSADLQRACQP